MFVATLINLKINIKPVNLKPPKGAPVISPELVKLHTFFVNLPSKINPYRDENKSCQLVGKVLSHQVEVQGKELSH